jgi:hypothetical protein
MSLRVFLAILTVATWRTRTHQEGLLARVADLYHSERMLSRRDCQICWNWGRERYGQLAEGESLLCWRFPSWMPANVFGAEPSRQGGAKPPLSFIVRVARGRNPRDVTVRTNQKGISRWSARRRRSTSSIIEVDRHPLPASPAGIAGEAVGAAQL